MSTKFQAKLARHASDIQTLDGIYAAVWPAFLVHSLNNLTVLKCPVLKFQCTTTAADDQRNTGIIAILAVSPNLHTLELGFFKEAEGSTPALLAAIRRHMGLRKIKVTHPEPDQMISISTVTIEQFLMACSHLESISVNLRIDYSSFSNDVYLARRQRLQRELDSAPPILTLKLLEFTGSICERDMSIILDFLKLCTNLTQCTTLCLSF